MKQRYDALHDVHVFNSGDVVWICTPCSQKNKRQIWDVKAIIHAYSPDTGGYWIKWIDDGFGDHNNNPQTQYVLHMWSESIHNTIKQEVTKEKYKK